MVSIAVDINKLLFNINNDIGHPSFELFNPLSSYLECLIDLSQSNTFYSSKGNGDPLGLKGLQNYLP